MTVINTMSSGLPYNLNYNGSSSASNSTGPLFTTDLVTLRPQHINNLPIVNPASSRVKTATALTGYLNRASLDFPSYALYGNTSAYGNVSRNILRSYAFYQTDLGIHKAFPLWHEGTTFDFRAEAFNVLNKVNYQAPDGNISNGSFGTIVNYYPARQLQLAAKIIF